MDPRDGVRGPLSRNINEYLRIMDLFGGPFLIESSKRFSVKTNLEMVKFFSNGGKMSGQRKGRAIKLCQARGRSLIGWVKNESAILC